MEKKLEEDLRQMQNNPTTGTAHNRNVVSAQVETIFAIDILTDKIKKLTGIVEKSSEQSEKLEQSNYRLQVSLLILTAIATTAILYQVLKPFIGNAFWVVVLSVLGGLFSYITGERIANTYAIKLRDTIHIKDKIHVVVKDAEGNIKTETSQ